MNKSKAYHLAQIAVLGTQNIAPENKLKVLRFLMDAEDWAILCEEQEMEKAAAEIDAELAADAE
jgi:hypothetical protein